MPCHRRAVAVEGLDSGAEKLVEIDAEGDGWVSTAETGHAADQETGIPDLDEAPARQQPGSVSQLVNTADDDVPDIDDLAIEEEDDEVLTLDTMLLVCHAHAVWCHLVPFSPNCKTGQDQIVTGHCAVLSEASPSRCTVNVIVIIEVQLISL